MKNKYMYIIVTILLILVLIFGTMVLNLTNKVGNIEKNEDVQLQLSENNAYISTKDHLEEIAYLSNLQNEYILCQVVQGTTIKVPYGETVFSTFNISEIEGYKPILGLTSDVFSPSIQPYQNTRVISDSGNITMGYSNLIKYDYGEITPCLIVLYVKK